MNFYPFNDMETISPRPMLFVAGENAHSREFSEDAYKRAAEPKELYIVPDICYFSEATLNPEIVYEYIINKHFYLVARAGASMVMMAGLYSDTRKGIKVRNEEGQTEVEPLVKMKRNMVPFFNLGVSYSLFK